MLSEIFSGIAAFGTLAAAGAVVVGIRQLRATEKQLELLQQQA